MPLPSAGRLPTRVRSVSWRACRWLLFWNCSGSGCRFCSTALYGFYIWYRGDSNPTEYPWTGNWMYTAQRWTGGIAFAYIVWHTYTLRFTGVDLHVHAGASFGKVQAEVFQTPLFVLRGWVDRGIVALRIRDLAVCGEMGFDFGREGAAAIFNVCLGLFLVMSAAGLASLYRFPVAPAAGDRSGGSAGHRGRQARPYGITDHGDPVEEWQLPKSLW